MAEATTERAPEPPPTPAPIPEPQPEAAPPPPKPFKLPRPARLPVESTLPFLARWGMPWLVLLTAFHFYHAELEEPSIVDFDEGHYIKVARNFTRGILFDPAWGDPRPQNFEHPPLGKYLIALGLWANGRPHEDMENVAYLRRCNFDNPECEKDAYAWRIGGAWAAAFGVLGMYWIGLRLFNRLSAGILTAGLLLLDGLYFLHARLAMLDIYPSAFCLLAFGLSLGPRSVHRWLGGVAFGLALASKFPATFLLPPFLLLHFLKSPHIHRWMRLRDALIRGFILPAGLFLASFAPFWVLWYQRGGGGWEGIRFALDSFVLVEGGAVRWDWGGDAQHPYTSPPWAWLAMTRPVWYYVQADAAGNVGKIYSIGNPALWWSATFALLAFWLRATPRWFLTEGFDLRFSALWDWWKRPFHFTRETSLWFASILFAIAYGAFYLVRREQFLFYFVLGAPYLSLFLGGLLSQYWSRGGAPRLLVLLLFSIIAATFAFYFPLVTGIQGTEQSFNFVFGSIRWMAR